MKGSVRKRKNNAWSYRIDLGYVDGKRKQVEKGGFKTEREATKAMQDVLYHLNNTGDYVENKKVSFHTVYEEFIEREGKATRAYATLKRYDSLYRNHIKDEFGPLYVYQISDTMIIDFLNQKRIKYSEEYVKGMYKFFNVILRYAHDHKYTKKNVMDLVPPPPDPRHVGDIVTYNRKELEQMIERIESTRSKIAFQLGLQAGLRESECFALTWSDIDFEKKKIKVCKQLLYQDKQWCFAPLKTVNSYRSVNITAEFAQYLADMKMQHDAERKLYGDGYKRNFVTDRREPTAILLMVDSNLQREELLPSEKAFAYKMKLDAMKRQGQRTDLTCARIAHKSDGIKSRDILAEQIGESKDQIRRYIRLTSLVPDLLNRVDNKTIAFNAAVEVSYLTEPEQKMLCDAIEREECTPNLKQARRLKQFSQDGKLGENVIDAIMTEEKPIEDKLVLKGDVLAKYFPKTYTPSQKQKVIVKLLEDWHKRQLRQQER